MPNVDTIIRISDDYISLLKQDGFLAVENILSDQDIEEVRQFLDVAFTSRENNVVNLGKMGTQDTLELANPSRYEPRLKKVSAISKCSSLAAKLMKTDVVMAGDHAIYKMPNAKSTTAWHQDDAYGRGYFAQESITMWIPLQSVNGANGCMSFVRGSHQSGLFPHGPRDGDERNHAREATGFDRSNIVECPLREGGVTIHLPQTLHSAAPNSTDDIRRAWILSFAPRSGYQLKRAANFAIRRMSAMMASR